MKKYLLIGLILLFAIPCQARMNVGIVGGGVAAAPPACTIDDAYGSDTSANYTAITASGIQVASGYLNSVDWERSWAFHETSLGSANNYAQATVSYSGENESGGVICRSNGNGTSATGYIAYFFGGEVLLESFAGSTKTGITSYNGSYSYTPTAYVLKISCNGTAIKVSVDGVERISATDSTYSAGNYIGVYSGRNAANSTASVDNLCGAAQ